MRCRIAVAVVLLSLPLPAGAQPRGVQVQAPDGRVGLSVEGDASPSGGWIRAKGNLGAHGFDNTLYGSPDGGGFTNPPFYGAYTSDGPAYEETFGPRVANATIGAGGITEGVDASGRMTGLSWPSPGYWDHVNYVTVTRGYPNSGAASNAGSFGGTGAAWLLPEFGWRAAGQEYGSSRDETLVTRLTGPDGLEVAITDVVDPELDLVARNFRFSAPPPGGFAYYANMNPVTSRLPRVPSITDAALDGFSDFGTIWEPEASAMLHFRPYTADPASLSAVATQLPAPAAALGAAAGAFGPGVYVAMGGQGRSAAFQAGLNSARLVRGEADGTPAIDPFDDLLADGRLSGWPAAFGKTAGAFAPAPDEMTGTSYTVWISAASNPSEALAAVRWGRELGFDAFRARSEAWWGSWIDRARLPATGDARVVDVARRSLMLIKTAQDRVTGAIVANATTQTPYRQDWVRDGAFFNYALLLAGYPEMAIAHADFYRRLYRPGGTWDSIYYADGAEGDFVFPYEIDSQAFALWALWLPYEFGAAGPDYLQRVWPAIRDTAEALLLCHDPVSGMQCHAAEDDAIVPTQGAQGASTVFLALLSASSAAREVGDQRAWGRYAVAANMLREATLRNEDLCPAEGSCGRGGVYLLWPSRLVGQESAPELFSRLVSGYRADLDALSSFSAPPAGGSMQYPMEPVLALASVTAADVPAGQAVEWVRWLSHDVPEPGVLHYAERIFRCDGQAPCDAGRRYLHTIGFPHIWSGAEAYLAAAFVHGVTGCPPGQRVGEAACR